MDIVGESSVRLPKTAQRINTAIRHKTDVGSRKTVVFFWLDQGLPRMAVRYLAKTKLGLRSSSVRAYFRDWNNQNSLSR